MVYFSIPNNFATFPHLQTLKLEGNKLRQIRTDIIKAGTTRILQHLREKQKESQESTITPKVSLEEGQFPDRFTMRNGNMLNLAMKNISHIPDECFNEAKEANVTIVDICKNIFTEVPSGYENLENNYTKLFI